MKKVSLLILCSLLFSLSSCNQNYPDLKDGIYTEFKTNKGDFVAELYYQATPLTVANFVSLAEGNNEKVNEEFKGKKFYNGLVFHRVIKDFMIQAGDPQGTGSGDPGYKFPDEFVDSLKLDSKGILAMANSGPNTNGSQFFITLKETPWLTGRHTVFGKIVKGQDVVDSIGEVETATGDKPVKEVVIKEVNIIRKGKEAKDFDAPTVLDQEMKSKEAADMAKEEQLDSIRTATVQKFKGMEEKAEELPSGLKIYFNEKADGEKPELGDKVLVNYQGYLDNGKLFDTNIEEIATRHNIFNPRRKDEKGYVPIPMEYSPEAQMIAGFKEGVQKMTVGDKTTLFIPAHLGYGERGAANVIPPNSNLIFQVELVGIQE